MQAWVGELMSLLHRVLGSPEAMHAEVIMQLIAVLTLLITFRLSLAIVGSQSADMIRTLLALLIGVMTLMGSTAATIVYVLPHVSGSLTISLATMLIPIAVTLLIGVPIQCLMLRSKYMPTAMALGSTLAMTMLVMTGSKALIGSLYAGKAESDIIRARKSTTENFINRQGQTARVP